MIFFVGGRDMCLAKCINPFSQEGLLLFSISSVLQCALVALIGSEILFSRDF